MEKNMENDMETWVGTYLGGHRDFVSMNITLLRHIISTVIPPLLA